MENWWKTQLNRVVAMLSRFPIQRQVSAAMFGQVVVFLFFRFFRSTCTKQQKCTYFICICLSLKGQRILFFFGETESIFQNPFILQISRILTTPSSDMKQIFQIGLLIETYKTKTRNAHFFSIPAGNLQNNKQNFSSVVFVRILLTQFCSDQSQRNNNESSRELSS